ncbi:MAG: hypothetical protein IKW00_01495 [Clostridia bacterium]|nr:hypothetical protein [Clostridia bacterium]
MKKFFLILAVFGLLALLTGISPLIAGIRERGWDGVNYGRILFPLLIAIASLIAYKRHK